MSKLDRPIPYLVTDLIPDLPIPYRLTTPPARSSQPQLVLPGGRRRVRK
jgi:hypothetical protein